MDSGWGARALEFLQRADLTACVLLALLSTALWWALSGAAWMADVGELTRSVLTWATGAIYSVLVLFRYVESRWRLAVVAAAGTFSYWLGIQIAATPADAYVVNTAFAGGITASFLAYVVARLGRLRLSWQLFATTGSAGVIGGAVIGLSIDAEGILASDGGDSVWFIVGHGLWQVLTCVAMFLAPQDPPPQRA